MLSLDPFDRLNRKEEIEVKTDSIDWSNSFRNELAYDFNFSRSSFFRRKKKNRK